MNKLASVEAQRVVGVLDEATERLGVVAFLSKNVFNEEILEMLDDSTADSLRELADIQGRLDGYLRDLSAHFGEGQADLNELVDEFHDKMRAVGAHFRTNEADAHVITDIGTEAPGISHFVRTLDVMKKVIVEKASTVEQEQAEVEYFNKLRARIREAENDKQMLLQNLRAEQAEKENNLKVLDEGIEKLRAEILEIRQKSAQELTALRRQAKEKNESNLTAHQARISTLDEQLEKLQAKVVEESDDHRIEEDGMKKRKLKANGDLDVKVRQYDQEMEKIEDEMGRIRNMHSEELAELKELEEYFLKVDKDLANEAEEERILIELQERELEKIRLIGLKIARLQAIYRGHKCRVQLASAKNKKAGKGKGKKKKK